MLSSENVFRNYVQGKKILTELSIDYENVYCCPNNCSLYRKDYEDLE